MKVFLVWLARLAFLAALSLLTYVALIAPDQVSSLDSFIPWDKAAHFMGYYALAGLALVAFPRVPTVVLFLLLFTQSALVEALQPYFGRNRDLFDLLANCAGLAAVVAPLCAYKVRWYCMGSPDVNLTVFDRARGKGAHESI